MNDYILGYLNGILDSFSALNGTSYLINPLPRKETINEALIEYFNNKNSLLEFELELIEDNNWVFLKIFLKDHLFYFINEKNLSHKIYDNSSQDQFVNIFLDNLYRLHEVKKIYKLKSKTDRNILIEFENQSYYIFEMKILY